MINSLPHALDHSAQLYPEKDAVRSGKKILSYAELQRQANSLAAILRANGVQRGDRVGLYMNKDVESAVSVYGIMKAGAAYVPLDPYAPVSRLSYVVTDCSINIVLSKPNKLEQLKEMVANTSLSTIIGVDAVEELGINCIAWDDVLNAVEGTDPSIHVIEQDLSYILYTSGSTGVPKGIMHTHRSALSFANWAATEYGITSDDVLSNHAPLHFDLSTLDLYASVVAGATTVIIPEFVTKFPASLSKLIQQHKISVWYSVPFALMQLVERGALETRDLSSLRWVLFAGEPYPTKHLRKLLAAIPHAKFSNLYGPTETNVCTFYNVEGLPDDNDDPIPIGIPCSNEEALIVDADNNEVALGKVGELLMRGGTIMRGYWGRPDLNERGFFKRRVFDHYEDIFYRTGDLVQQQPDGNLLYLGRKDRQVKIRGYRVELDEIEVALLSHEGVQEAAVFIMADGLGSNRIEAAAIAREGNSLSDTELTQIVANKLPDYAVPEKIHVMDEFPRTSTGKINRRGLQEMSKAKAEAIAAD